MKVNLPSNEENFNITSSLICGVEGHLITPKLDAKWSKDNLYYRSLILDKKGKVLSSGFPKFFNFGEQRECYPEPTEYFDWQITEKVDGSLVICDYIKKQFNMRTRGTFSFTTQPNFKDFELLTIKYPKVIDFLKKNKNISLLLEIVTPNNVIVVRPKEIDFYLIGAVDKDNLKLLTSEELTEIWRYIGNIPTPQIYTFDTVNDLNFVYNYIKQWKGKEGVILSYNNNQNKIKLKSDWYCFIHRVKSQLCSTNNLIEYYVEKEMPGFEAMFKLIESEFDYEIAIQLKDEIEKICTAGSTVKKYIYNILDFLHDIRKIETRKEQAEIIKRNYGCNSSFVFNILDNKTFSKEQWIKLINQKLN